MFRADLGARTARGMAVGALVLSLTASALSGVAHAAPSMEEGRDCSTLAHARNDAVHTLHVVWKTFRGDLKELAREARMLQKEAHKSGVTLTSDARDAVAAAQQELTTLRTDAHAEIQGLAELGTECKAEADTTTTTTTTTSDPAPADATAPADSTSDARTFDTSDLADQYREVVDKAIADMQKVVDDAAKAVADMAAAAETRETVDDEQVTAEVAKAKSERAKVKEERAKEKVERVKEVKEKKNNANANANSKGKGKGRG